MSVTRNIQETFIYKKQLIFMPSIHLCLIKKNWFYSTTHSILQVLSNFEVTMTSDPEDGSHQLAFCQSAVEGLNSPKTLKTILRATSVPLERQL